MTSSACWADFPYSTRRKIVTDCFGSRASSTVAKYVKEIRRFFSFESSRFVAPSLPADVARLAEYLSQILDKKTKSSCQSAFSALKWVHGLLPLSSNPLDSQLCSNLVEVERRLPHNPVKKKEPVDIELIKKICYTYANSSSSLKDLRIATLCVLSFAGLFRSQEVLDIKACHISWMSDYLIINVPRSKTDVYRLGQKVFVAKTNSSTCPYTLLLRYLSSANIKLGSDVYIFRNVVFFKSKKCYSLGTHRLSYSRFYELFKECLSFLGYDSSIYGLHSFRSGGATSLALGLSDNPSKERLLKLHGRWKSDHAKNMYIKESLDDRLKVSRTLGL